MKRRITLTTIIGLILMLLPLMIEADPLDSYGIVSFSKTDEFVCNIALNKEEVEAGLEITAIYEYSGPYTLYSATWYNVIGYSTASQTITISTNSGETTYSPREKGICYFSMIFTDSEGGFHTFKSNVARVLGLDVVLEPEKRHVLLGETQTVHYSIIGDIDGSDITGYWWIKLFDNPNLIFDVNPVTIVENTGALSYTTSGDVEEFGFHIDGVDKNGGRVHDYSNEWWSVCPADAIENNPEVPATCVNTGLTEGEYCSACGMVIIEQEEIPALGHTVVIDEAIAPTCTETGLTEGRHCSVCNAVLLIQDILTELGHNWSKPSYDWKEDNSQVTASRTCKRDDTHVETETVYTTSVTIPASYTATGRIIYTAEFRNPVFKKQTKKVTIPRLPVDITQNGNKYHLDPKKKTATFTGPEKKTVTSLIIPDSIIDNETTFKVTEVARNACNGLSKLKTVTLGNNIKSIEQGAFSKCKKLNSVSGGENVTTIGASAFEQCSALTSFTLNSNVKTIGAKAFFKCKKLAKMIVKTAKLTDKGIGSNAFSGIYKKVVFKCPEKKLKIYQELFRKKGAPKTAVYEQL